MQLLQLPAGRVAEAREIRCRADDVGEHEQHLALETTRQLLLQLVLHADDLGHRQVAEIAHRHRADCQPGAPEALNGSDEPTDGSCP